MDKYYQYPTAYPKVDNRQIGYGYHEPENVPPRAPQPPHPADGHPDTQEYEYVSDNGQGINNDLNGPHVGGHLMPLAQDGSQEEVIIMRRADLSMATGGPGFTMGRHISCSYIVDHTAVSNKHCRFSFRSFPGPTAQGIEGIVLEDLSTNGTLINDQLVGKGNVKRVNDGDSISITNAARFIFQLPAQQRHQASEFEQYYSLFQALGAGTFATVYLAREKSTSKAVAVKKFVSKTVDKGIEREISVLKAVSHPSLLCMIDYFPENDGFYLVLEYAPEGDLLKYVLKNRKLSEAKTRSVLRQLCSALKYLHDRTIIHRDIKLENILVMDLKPTIKLADFGLSKIVGEQSFTTTMCGTPDYAAPEVIDPRVIERRYTQAVDLWSVGVVLFVCLSGYPPFSEQLYSPANPYHLIDQIVTGRYHYLRPYWDGIDDSAIHLINCLLCVDSQERITVDECLTHPWVTMAQRPSNIPMAPHNPHLNHRSGGGSSNRRAPQKSYYGDRSDYYAATPRGNGKDMATYLDESQGRRTFEEDSYRAPQQRRFEGKSPDYGFGFGNDSPLYSFDA